MPPELTVVIRTHNPHSGRLGSVLAGLHAQSLPQDLWELVLIDNCSEPALDPSNLPPLPRNTRVVLEKKLGSSHAYARGFREAAAELVVYVDDDTVPAAEYLQRTLELSEGWPHLGAWGAARIEPEFEAKPPEEAQIYFKYLALREDRGDRWSNNPEDVTCIPFGPGLTVRRSVGLKYAQALESDRRRGLMGKIGKGLGASEDLDLALTAFDSGLGFGVFSALSMTHLIPTRRVTRDYLDQLVFEIERSEAILMAVRGLHKRKPGRLDVLLFALRALRASPPERRLLMTRQRGRKAGEAMMLGSA